MTGKGMVHPDSPSHTPAWGLALLRRANRCRQGLTCPGVMAGIQAGGSGTQGEEGLELSHGRPPSSRQGLQGLRGAQGRLAEKQRSGPSLPWRRRPHSTREEERLARQVRRTPPSLPLPDTRAKPPGPEHVTCRVRGGVTRTAPARVNRKRDP